MPNISGLKNAPNWKPLPDLPFASENQQAGKLEPDYADAYNAWKADDSPINRGAMLQQVQPVVDTAVFSYAGKGASPYLKGQAKLLALDAIKTYDSSKGSLKTHLLSQLRRLQRLSAQSQQPIRIPERVALDRQALLAVTEELRDDLGREPNDLELSDRAGISLGRIRQIRRAKTGINTGSLLGDDGEVYTPGSQLPGSDAAEDAWAEMVYYDLGETDRLIMDYTLGLNGRPALSNSDLAAKLDLSPGAVSQRKAKIQAMLDSRHQFDLFSGGG